MPTPAKSSSKKGKGKEGVSSAASAAPSHFKTGGFQRLLDGEESIEALQLRMRLYTETWAEMENKINVCDDSLHSNLEI